MTTYSLSGGAVGLVFICVLTTAIGCGEKKKLPTDGGEALSGTIRAAPSEGDDEEEKVYRSFRYHFVGPVGCRLSIWMECRRNDKLDALSPLTRGRWYVPGRGKGLDGYFEYKLLNGKKLGASGLGKVRWEWNEDWQPGGVRGGAWISDPFGGEPVSSTWDTKGQWTPKVGEICTLLTLRGKEVALVLRARFDPSKPIEQLETLNSGGLDVQSVASK